MIGNVFSSCQPFREIAAKSAGMKAETLACLILPHLKRSTPFPGSIRNLYPTDRRRLGLVLPWDSGSRLEWPGEGGNDWCSSNHYLRG